MWFNFSTYLMDSIQYKTVGFVEIVFDSACDLTGRLSGTYNRGNQISNSSQNLCGKFITLNHFS
jgi:hypothetical protein